MKEPLTLDVLLGMSCSNPEDFREHEAYQREAHKARNTPGYKHERDYKPYRGWNRYSITLHCAEYTIIARLLEDGTYEIKDYYVQDH